MTIVVMIIWQQFASHWSGAKVAYSIFWSKWRQRTSKWVQNDGLTIRGAWVKKPANKKRADGKGDWTFQDEFETSIPIIEDRTVLNALLEKNTEVVTSHTTKTSLIDLLGTLIMIAVSVVICLSFCALARSVRRGECSATSFAARPNVPAQRPEDDFR